MVTGRKLGCRPRRWGQCEEPVAGTWNPVRPPQRGSHRWHRVAGESAGPRHEHGFQVVAATPRTRRGALSRTAWPHTQAVEPALPGPSSVLGGEWGGGGQREETEDDTKPSPLYSFEPGKLLRGCRTENGPTCVLLAQQVDEESRPPRQQLRLETCLRSSLLRSETSPPMSPQRLLVGPC